MTSANIFSHSILSVLAFDLFCIISCDNQFESFKASGTKYLVIYPARPVRILHHDVTPSTSEEIKIIHDLKLTYYKMKDNFKSMWNDYVADVAVDEHSYLEPGAYVCENGKCIPIELTEEQKNLLTEPTKGKEIFLGNQLTKKFKIMKNKIIPPPPIVKTKPLNLKEEENNMKNRKEWLEEFTRKAEEQKEETDDDKEEESQ